MWACVHVCRCLWKLEEAIGSPGAGVMGSCGPPDMGAVEPNSNPLQNQHLATEKSLQPLYFPFLPLRKRSGRQPGILYPFLVFKYFSAAGRGYVDEKRMAAFSLGGISPVTW